MIIFIKKAEKLTPEIAQTFYLPICSHGFRIIFFVSLMNILLSCGETGTRDIPLQGTIEYDINYIENNTGGVSERMLPKKMVVTFNEQFVMQRIDGLMGLFSIFHIACNDEITNNTYLKIGPYKYTYTGSAEEMAAGFGYYKVKAVIAEEGNYRIAGLDAQKARIVNSGSYDEPYTVFYSDDFPVPGINKFNPYKDIEGILLDFRLEINGLKMHLVAKETNFREVDEKIFFPEDYRSISRKEMDDLITALFD